MLTPAAGSPAAALQSVVLQFLLVALVPLAFAHLSNLDKRATFSLRRVTANNLLWCFLLAFSVLFLLDEIAVWQERLTGVRASLSPEIQELLRADSALQLVWIFFALALTPAICEELLFRGFILGRFLETGQPGQSLMMTSLLFGLFHRNLPALLPTTLAGIVLGLCVWRTGSLYCAIRHARGDQHLGHSRGQYQTRRVSSLDSPAQPRASMAAGGLCLGGCRCRQATTARTSS